MANRGREKRTPAQLLKEAAGIDREALLLFDSLPGMQGAEAVARAKQVQALMDRARSLRGLARERRG